MLALFVKSDRYGFHPEYRGDQRCKSSYRAPNRSREDGLKGLTLLFISLIIEVQGHGPVALSHRSRCARDQSNIQAIKGYAAIVSPIHVETKGNLTSACCRLRGQGRVWRKETRTHYITVTVLEVISRDLPAGLY